MARTGNDTPRTWLLNQRGVEYTTGVDPGRFQKLSEIFEAALLVEPKRRDEWLAAKCGGDTELRDGVVRLPKHHSATGGLLEDAEGGRLPEPAQLISAAIGEVDATSQKLPDRIGTYKIVRRIGQGGMGTVYEALQANPERTVALKVVSARFSSEASLKRFDYESYVLGQLQHPGIAQVYDAGTAQSREGVEPFFAMELVDGERLTDYATQQALNTREKLELVARICDAIHHAHQKGIVHRDLKPGNILVTAAGDPKILDFGIARAVDDDARRQTLQTGTGEIVGTLAYMSPEQTTGDASLIDTRSDIYSLGIILYELLAGRLPFEVETTSLFDALRSIRDEEPPRIGRLQPALRGDVETIVHTALAKETDRRYASAAEFGADIGRFLRNEAISAHPPSAIYQLQKFAVRNKVLVAAAVAIIVVLVAGITTSIWYALQSQRDAKLATQRLAESQAVTAFLQDTLAAGDPYSVEQDPKLSTLLKARTLALRDDESMATATRAALLESLAMAYYGVAFYEDAESLARQALEIRRQHSEAASPEVAESLWNLANIVHRQGRYDEARETLEEALAVREAIADGPDLRIADVLDLLSTVLWLTEAGGEEEVQRQALQIRQALLPGDNLTVAVSLRRLGTFLSGLDRNEEAEALFRDAIAMARRFHGGSDDNPDVTLAQEKLAEHFLRRNRPTEALTLLTDVLKRRRGLLPGDHPDLATTISLCARAYSRTGDSKKALLLAEEALNMRQKIFGTHQHSATSLLQVGTLHRVTGNPDRSQQHLEAALAMQRALTPEGDHARARCLSELAETLAWQGHFEAALSHQEKALAIFRARAKSGGRPQNLGDHLTRTATLYLRSGDALRAQDYAAEALQLLRPSRPEGHLDIVGAEVALATALQVADASSPQAEEIYRRVIPRLDDKLGEDSLVAGESRMRLASILMQRDAYQEAELLLRRAQAAIEKAYGPGHSESLRVKSLLGMCLLAVDRTNEAEPLLLACYVYSRNHSQVRAAIELLLLNYQSDPGRQAALQTKLRAADAARKKAPADQPRDVVTTLAPHLQGDPFPARDRRVRHAISYWEVREDGAEYSYNPAYSALVRADRQEPGTSLTSLQIPAGVVLPSRTYYWRVLYVGTDRMAVGFSDEKSFRTADLPLEIVRFDLEDAFRQDIVAAPGETENDSFDGDRRGLLVVAGFGGNKAAGQASRGLPANRRVGIHELGDYRKPNAIQLSAADTQPVRLKCRPHRSLLLRFLVSGGNGDSTVPVRLEFSDGSSTQANVHCDDWFHDHPPDNLGYLHPGVTAVLNGMDRLYMGELESANDPALFEALVELDGNQMLEAMTLLPADGTFDDSDSTRFNLLAISSIARRD